MIAGICWHIDGQWLDDVRSMGCGCIGCVGSLHCETWAKAPSLVEEILEFQVPVANVVCVPQMPRCKQKTVPSRALFSLTEPLEPLEPLEPWFRKILALNWLNFSAGQFSASRQQVVHSIKHLLCRLLHSLSCTQRHPHTRKAIFAMPSNECLTNRSSFSRSPLSLFSSLSLYLFDKCVPLRMCTYFEI